MSIFPDAYTDLACEKKGDARPARRTTEKTERGFRTLTQRAPREQENGLSEEDCVITVFADGMWAFEEEKKACLSFLLAQKIRLLGDAVFSRKETPKILVAGIGNARMTADAIGPETAEKITVTRHLSLLSPAVFRSLGSLSVAAIAPGVVGQTGIETADLIEGAVKASSPDLILAFDALASCSLTHLFSTVQLTNNGISPGSGLKNNRTALDFARFGVPVIGIGVPTVTSAPALVFDFLSAAGEEIGEKTEEKILAIGEGYFVSPKEADQMLVSVSAILARAADLAFSIGEA
ncbi:MAG: GPR endopeptidase [Clostridia bacterium]|nr:GPR endopeptidase [Clostridia bacterium]